MSKRTERNMGNSLLQSPLPFFMSSMFSIDLGKDSLSILDAGSGSGILSVALLTRIRESGYTGFIKLVCYETDEKVISLLARNLTSIKDSRLSLRSVVRTI